MKQLTCLLGYVFGVVCIFPLDVYAQVSVVPTSPKSQETVRVRVAPLQIQADAFDPAARQITMTGNKITVQLPLPGATFPVPPSPPTPALDIQLGHFPAGSYQVEVIRQVATNATESIGTASFTVTQDNNPTSPIQNNTDLWWDPNQSGWGLYIVQHGSGIIVASWLNYASDGRATWYVIPGGRWESSTRFVGPIYLTTGPEVSDVFNPALVTAALVGNAVFAFSAADSNRMTAQLTLGGRTVSRDLARQAF